MGVAISSVAAVSVLLLQTKSRVNAGFVFSRAAIAASLAYSSWTVSVNVKRVLSSSKPSRPSRSWCINWWLSCCIETKWMPFAWRKQSTAPTCAPPARKWAEPSGTCPARAASCGANWISSKGGSNRKVVPSGAGGGGAGVDGSCEVGGGGAGKGESWGAGGGGVDGGGEGGSGSGGCVCGTAESGAGSGDARGGGKLQSKRKAWSALYSASREKMCTTSTGMGSLVHLSFLTLADEKPPLKAMSTRPLAWAMNGAAACRLS